MSRIVALLVVLASASLARAHEFGVMRVSLIPSSNAIDISIELDPELLASPYRAMAIAAHEQRPDALDTLERAFAEAATVSFNGRRAELEALEPLPIPDRPADVVPLRFRARIEPGPVVWSHAWATDAYAVSVDRPGADREFQWVEGPAASVPIDLGHAHAQSLASVALEYLVLGYEHIVPKGLDHILFVLGLFFMSSRPRAVLSQTLAFTVAHSITLALAIFGVVRISPSIVEPLIALSIALVAIENVLVREHRPRRTALVFVFGLLHGLGFAGVLADLGLPAGQVVPALASFNVGVELGQLTVVAAAYLAVGLGFGRRAWYRARVAIPASVALALVGLYWTVERGLL